jgi:hypothetical protein
MFVPLPPLSSNTACNQSSIYASNYAAHNVAIESRHNLKRWENSCSNAKFIVKLEMFVPLPSMSSNTTCNQRGIYTSNYASYNVTITVKSNLKRMKNSCSNAKFIVKLELFVPLQPLSSNITRNQSGIYMSNYAVHNVPVSGNSNDKR